MRRFVFICLIITLAPGVGVIAQISPGDLAEPHAHLEGISNCTKCHVLGQKVSNEKCLDCHTELKSRIGNSKGYHASAEVSGKECVVCHSDHHGRKFEMIRFDKRLFDHDLTGYSLQGAHNSLECADCHKKEYIVDTKVREKKYTFLGLGTGCLDCHEDQHRGTLASNCTDCHNLEKFKPASNFDHERAAFVLRGRHRDVACIECHRMQADNKGEFQVFKGISHRNCTDCHRDPHQGRFGNDCRRCHTEESFHVIKGMSEFNHDLTDFALEGKHLFVSCAECHKGSYTEPLKHERCSDCHDDYHRSQFGRQGGTPDCSSCHDTRGFTMTSFTVDRHNEADFRLKGAHLATPCFACHYKKDRWEFRKIGMQCNDCHSNIHEGSLDIKYLSGSSCENCHSVNFWSDINFQHDKTGWELQGAHKSLPCRDCHFVESPEGNLIQRFKELESNCNSCHEDVHAGQFDEGDTVDCTRCHEQENWNPDKFDHNTSRFILDGKHRYVACNKCHILVTEENKTYRKFKFEDISCESCHR